MSSRQIDTDAGADQRRALARIARELAGELGCACDVAAPARRGHGAHPIVVVEDAGRIVGFASTSTYRPRECYARVAEFSVYVARDARGRGVGRLALRELIAAAARAGLGKLVSRIFPENHASRAVCRVLGFREVGVYENHGQLDGAWKDCVIVERLLGGNPSS